MHFSQVALEEALGRAASFSYISEHQQPEPTRCIVHLLPCIIIPGVHMCNIPAHLIHQALYNTVLGAKYDATTAC